MGSGELGLIWNGYILVNPQLLTEILLHANAAAPAEVCGFTAGVDQQVLGVEWVRNIAPDPTQDFTLSQEDMRDALLRIERHPTWEVMGLIHSHPSGEAVPSINDMRYAGWMKLHPYIVVSQEGLRAWDISTDYAQELGVLVDPF